METNTDVTLTFEGVPLTHTGDPNSKMLTTYWAFTAAGVDEKIDPVPNWRVFPKQVRPKREIGYFGEGKVPRIDGGYRAVNIPHDGVYGLLALLTSGRFLPKQQWVEEAQIYNGITTNGIYAFQVFGFAGTDEISSQREGDYVGKIILTVAK